MPTPLPTPLSSGPRVWPRLKFIWRSSEVIQGRWWAGLFCSYERRPGYPGTGLAISVRGLLRWTLILGVTGYLAGAAAIAQWFARTPYNQIRFTDVLAWPVRRGHVAELRGRGWLAQGKEAVKAKRWAEGVFLLRKGLDLCPDDFDARLVLAQFHLLGGQRTRAIALLIDGALQRLPPPAWREQVCALAAAGEDWASTLRFCDRCLSQLPKTAPAVERQTLLMHKLTALIALDRAGEALALAETEGEAAGTALKIERVQALRALRRPAEAATLLAQWRATASPGELTALIRLQTQALREAGRFDEMERALSELRTLHPARAEPMAFAVEQRARAGRGAATALEDYLLHFGSTPANLLLVVTPLAEIPDVALVRAVVAAAAERGYAPRPFQVQLALALLRQGEWTEFDRLVTALAPRFEKAEAEGRLLFEWMRVLSAGLATASPAADAQLVAFMRTRPLGLPVHRMTLAALHRAGRDATARDVLAVSRQLYAESPALLALQIEIEHAFAAAAAVVVAAQPAVPAPLASAVSENWRGFFQTLDDAIAAARWPDAQQLAHAARFARPAPAWLGAHDAELRWREVRIAQGARDSSALRLSLGLYLDGSATHAAEVVQFARDLHAAGEADDALALLKAVLEKSPDHPLATSLLAQWRPRRKANED